MISCDPVAARPFTLIFGLSGDPVHCGHIEMAVGALAGLNRRGYAVAQALIVPVYRRNPVGAAKGSLPATFEQRFAMCELAATEVAARTTGIPVRVSRIEADIAASSSEPNYAAVTLARFSEHEAANTRLLYLISSELVAGDDPEFSRWYRPDEILRLATLAICPRAGFPANGVYLQSLTQQGASVVVLGEVAPPDIASRELRRRMVTGTSPEELAAEGLIPASIAAYLATTPLYRDN